jgi:hypothetical protein
VVALLAAIVSAPSLTNGFAYDDVPILRDNPRVHQIATPWSYLTESYWHWSHCCAGYRPISVWFFSLEWAAGGGAPWIFHALNVTLFAAATAAVYRVARSMMGARAAFIAAALFAVHPVHVEAVANVVGQEEILLACVMLLALSEYLRARRRPEPPPPQTRIALAALTLAAPLIKEQGIVLPLVLLAAELTIVSDARSWRHRARALVPTFRLMVLALALASVARTAVLGGLGAGVLAATLEGLDWSGRVLTALSFAPAWTRLLLWPAHLQADYTPPAYSATTGFGLRELAGLLMIMGVVGVIVTTWRRRPVVAFGLLWAGLTLAPVSNVVFPTGILIAERTLFLPSIGIVLALAGGVEMLRPVWLRMPRLLGPVAVTTAIAILVSAGVLTATRQRLWQDNDVLFARTLQEAPDSYRAHWLYANWADQQGHTAEALRGYRAAVALYQGDPKLYEDFGQLLRRTGSCREAIPQFSRAVALDTTRIVARSRLFECRMAIGEYAAARNAVAREVAAGGQEFAQMLARAERAIALHGSSTPPDSNR